jgi:hypothetical protein
MRWAAALLLCAAATLTACGTNSSGTLPAVAGGFGTDPLISLPAGKPPASLVVHTLSQGSGPVVRASDYVMFDVEGKVWAGDRLVIDSFTDHQPQGLPLRSGLPGGASRDSTFPSRTRSVGWPSENQRSVWRW